MKIEYRIRDITRYIVTRFEDDGDGTASCMRFGEYDNDREAYAVAYALCKKEHQELGYPLGDERIIYPESVEREDSSD